MTDQLHRLYIKNTAKSPAQKRKDCKNEFGQPVAIAIYG